MSYLSWMWEVVKRGLIGLLLVVDCLCNCLLGGSIQKTLSGEAWHHRDHKFFFWTYRFIDALPIIGYPGHCEHAAAKEKQDGSVWIGWWRKTRSVWVAHP